MFLLLGAATTVGVAWGLVAWGPTRVRERHSTTLEGQGMAQVIELRAPGIRRRFRQWTAFGASPGSMLDVRVWDIADRSSILISPELEPWGLVADLPDSQRIADDARGWPMLAMWSGWHLTWAQQPGDRSSQPVPVVVNGIRINTKPVGARSGAFLDGGTYKALPLMPIPTGFAANTAFYAAAWGSIALGAVGARRLHRSRRGRCPRCGYDLRGLPVPGCPECGRGRAAAAMPIDDAAMPTE